jgi:hypothetical protein
MSILKKTLEDYCSIYTIIDRDIKINKIIIDLTNNYKLLLEKLNDMPEDVDNIIINKINITQTRYYYEIPFYKFILNSSIIISNNKLNNIINNIIIPVNQYNIMKSRYNDNIDFIDTIIWIQLYRYQLLSSNNKLNAGYVRYIKTPSSPFIPDERIGPIYTFTTTEVLICCVP